MLKLHFYLEDSLLNKLIKKNMSPLLCGLFFLLFISVSIAYSLAKSDTNEYIPPDTITSRNIYHAMEAGESHAETEIILVNDVKGILWETYAAYPEVSLNYTPRVKYKSYASDSDYVVGIDFTRISDDDSKYKELEANTAYIINTLQMKSDAEKAYGARDWIKSRCSYTDRVLNMWDECLYGCLVKGSATCLGFSQGYYYMMRKLHVPCKIVYTKYHAWNEVLIDGEWVVIDLTK